MRKFYLGLTTTRGSNWREKILEIDSLGISDLALFPTVLKAEERKEFYDLLNKSHLKKASFVHLRTDMERWEIDFFIERYGTEVFNIHSEPKTREFLKANSDIKDVIYIENCFEMSGYEESLALSAGICFDISHYEDFAIKQKMASQERFKNLLEIYSIGCTHISAVKEQKYEAKIHNGKTMIFESHTLNSFSEVNYLQRYKKYLSKHNAIELNNSLAEQLKVKEYLEKKLAQD